MTAPSMLRQRLTKIPREIYKKIFDLVLTPCSEIVTIDRDYKPPSHLHISRANRRIATCRYYTDTIFLIHEDEQDTFLRWLSSLSRPHLYILRNIYHRTKHTSPNEVWDQAASQAYWEIEDLSKLATAQDTPISPQYLYINVEYRDEYGFIKETWESMESLIDNWFENGMRHIPRP